jgi:probable FeS assembly SUF system protein SufT
MELHPLTRAVTATVIPAGTTLELPIGTIVQVVQSLGGSVTVRTDQGLFRLSPADASAIQGFTAAAQEDTGHREFSEQAVWDALRTCFDPEIPINIVDLGLIYDLAVEKAPTGGNRVEVKMTLTAPGCGMGPVIAEDARQKIQSLPDVAEAKVHIVWDPIWTPQMISPEGRKKLGLE